MDEKNALLQVKHLKKYYPLSRGGLRAANRKYLKAVDDVSFVLHKGEICGLVGESGCGKSTLGRTVLRLHSCTDGEIIFDGRNIESCSMKELRPLRRDMQIIFQDPYASLSPRMTIFDAVKASLDIHDPAPEAEKRKKVSDMLHYVGISEQNMQKYPHELSGGQRQRVVIARAMITRPRLVICDEPVSALDVSVRAQVLNLMRKMQREMGTAYLFISHDLSVVRYLCERVMVMYLGKLVETADKKELFQNPLHPYTKALISAIPVPDIDSDHQRMILQGDIPSPVDPPMGCYFHTRCPYATELCASESPELKEFSPGHCVACHYAGKV